MTLVSLNQFLRQLDRYGFLTPGVEPAAPKDQELWAPREQWDESLRTLFQSGTRLFRQGRAGEAVRYFEAMLEQGNEAQADTLGGELDALLARFVLEEGEWQPPTDPDAAP